MTRAPKFKVNDLVALRTDPTIRFVVLYPDYTPDGEDIEVRAVTYQRDMVTYRTLPECLLEAVQAPTPAMSNRNFLQAIGAIGYGESTS